MAFVVFEGLDASGKSTLMKKVEALLREKGQSIVTTREPGGTRLGNEIREMLLQKEKDNPSPRTELLLYEAGRAQHVDKVIQPALARGDWVLCDRFTASTVAFQSGGRGLQMADINWLNHFATNDLEPDLWVLLDLPVTESFQRMDKRTDESGQGRDRFESEKADFHERVRQSYMDLARANSDSWLVLNAGNPPEQLLEEFLTDPRVQKWLES